jgi:hypothetical protein
MIQQAGPLKLGVLLVELNKLGLKYKRRVCRDDFAEAT